jgi:hypothetical protein
MQFLAAMAAMIPAFFTGIWQFSMKSMASGSRYSSNSQPGSGRIHAADMAAAPLNCHPVSGRTLVAQEFSCQLPNILWEGSFKTGYGLGNTTRSHIFPPKKCN